jgi:hypothetical protein
MTQRNNIEIDYCAACRGVWLDKGELDKMLAFAERPVSTEKPDVYRGSQEQTPYYSKQNSYNKPYKKKSFLGDLFDFD